MQSKATTVDAYLKSLPADRRAALQAVRKVILANLDKDYAECMNYGMIGYVVPHTVYPPGYHCNPALPLPFAGLASQKGHMSLYLMCVYGHAEQEKWLRAEYAKAGKKLDMGKACIRFRKVEDLLLPAIAAIIKRTTAKKYIAYTEALLQSCKPGKQGKQTAVKPATKPAKKAAKKTAMKPAKKPARRAAARAR